MRPVAVLCGPGNNGGDGFAAARHLASAGWPIRLALLGTRDDLSGDAANHADLWQGAAEPFSPEILDGAGVVLDAIFGAGLSRPVEGTAGQMIEALKARKVATCAVDVPSGVDGATGSVRGIAAPADITVTFFRKKPGHLLFPGRFLCGSVVLADIGIPVAVLEAIAPRTYENGPDLWLDRYPWPSIDGHKYLRGHALVLGGDMLTGASRLTARGAMHAGAGLVTLAAPMPTWMVYAASLIGVIVRSFDGVEGFNALLADERRNADNTSWRRWHETRFGGAETGSTADRDWFAECPSRVSGATPARSPWPRRALVCGIPLIAAVEWALTVPIRRSLADRQSEAPFANPCRSDPP
jgi:ADP-dependent NAD(P)H-hydrate dehydratase / NAD(P)H-hydrate epimerase